MVGGGVSLVDHCALETYSVLTRLPPPNRVDPAVAREYLATQFAGPLLRLSAGAYRQFVLELFAVGVSGSAVYDALVASTELAHGMGLITCDRRALAVYERYGVTARLL